MNALRTLSETLSNAVQEACKSLDGAPDIPVLVEDKFDTGYEIRDALGRLGLLVVIGVTGFERKASSGPLLFGTVRLVVSIIETPDLSRAMPGTPTAQQLATHLIQTLHWAKLPGAETPLRFQNFTRADDTENVLFQLNFVEDTVLDSTHNTEE